MKVKSYQIINSPKEDPVQVETCCENSNKEKNKSALCWCKFFAKNFKQKIVFNDKNVDYS